MKISDKALKLIGRKILGSMDSTTHQDDSPTPVKQVTGTPPSPTKLNLQSAPKPPKAPVLPFPGRNNDT
ncbi:MAG TPA: hypothetical protein ENJ80_15805 [Gammaproteobacteria bacterium]|nr:hypothetical protein [Gammaproteobacteria bacterium]